MSLNNPVWQQLHETALKAPSSSGVYMWRNPQGTVIYVGKAKNLKNRLSSYFAGNKDLKTRLLVSHAQSIEYITTANEYEAFLLENNLIKKYKPRYNIDLKDGKSYPVIRITKEEYPRLFKTRYVVQDGSTYFGPFPDVAALDSFIDAIYRIYPIRVCKKFKKRTSPCMYYHIGRCKAPCCEKISKESYNEFFGEIYALLERKGDNTIEKLTIEMKNAAKDMNFEKAARLRDGLLALERLQHQNIVEDFSQEDRDYIAHYREGELVSFTVLKIRGGKMQGRDNYRVTSLNEDNELLPEFMNAYYTDAKEIPPSIYVPTQEGLDFISRWIKETFDIEANIILVTDSIENASRHKAAIEMTIQNAKEDIIRRLRERGDMPAMQELKEILNLPTLPVRIEGFDIAHIGGKLPVASLISFYNGNPDKKNYRYFRLKTTDGIIDDFNSMREATSRRYTRLINEGSELPDLIMIDGGIGQVNAVDGVLKSLGVDIPIVGLAEKNEELYRPHNSTPIVLPRRSDGLRLLQRVRDETHRFATTQNQKLRTKFNTQNLFKDISGIGEKRAAVLLKKYFSLENLCEADAKELSEVLGIKTEQALSILKEAESLLKKQNETKEKSRHSLGAVGTTWQKAAENQYTIDLAEAALEAAEEEPEYGGDSEIDNSGINQSDDNNLDEPEETDD
ncbi:MAG: excinuclease ABC subunit UvrC [Treponema sp.]|uniref:excinuclease ABC subunit UvrC n=1 Tax=Treponema sp. TaxID=166 RepID=UPI00298EA41F|nr:excinuclease ABC subunit UvrC [Treponema sp.]MBR5932773.1 excinuclease ABC subunit UvrC [Treponema sp.]